MFIRLIRAIAAALGMVALAGAALAISAGAWLAALFTGCGAVLFLGLVRMMWNTSTSRVTSDTSSSNPFARVSGRRLLVILGGGFAAGVIVAAAVGVVLPRAESGYDQASLGFGLYGFIALALWIVAKQHSVDLSRLLGRLPRRRRVMRTLIMVAPLLLFSYGTVWILFYPISFVWPDAVERILSSDPVTVYAPDGTTLVGPNALTAIAVVVLAPVTEEIFFRGFLLHRWALRWGAEASVVATSTVFAMLHTDPLGAMFFGFVLAVVYIRTGSLLLVILCHVLNNLVAYSVAVGYTLLWETPDVYTIAEFHAEWWTAAIALAIAGPWVILFVRRHWPSNGWLMPYDRLPVGGSGPAST